MRLFAAALCALALVPAASAVTTEDRSDPPLVQTPSFERKAARLDEATATGRFLRDGKVRDWLARYPRRGRVTEATFKPSSRRWTVKVWWGEAGQIALGQVDDETGVVTETWTGPQVAWKMARGYDGAFGGKEINTPLVWLGFCLAFLLGLADLRRPFSVRNLDLLVLLSFSISLWFFNRGEIFASVPLAYPPLLYLLGRMLWKARRGGSASGRAVWPIWVLAAATVFLAGFRVGLNVQASNVIDVGYAGVIGAHRLASGEAPYGHMPVQDDLRACGPADAEGEIRERVQTNGRCESSNERGDTYGPVAYAAYLPGYVALGWSGKWDSLPAAHFTSIAFDLLCIVGLALVGRRFGGTRLAVTLAFAWAAYPFTQYVSSSNTNDAIMPALLIWGFWLVTSNPARGALLALAGWTKFAALLLAPLWLSYPEWRGRRPGKLAFVGGFLLATVLSFSVLLLEPDPLHAARVFWDRTLGWQVGRESPFSLWDWRQYHAGLPDLVWPQRVLEGLLVVGAAGAFFRPRRKSPLQLAALSAALLIGFQVVLTHWFYLYIPWFFPFVAFVLLAGRPRPGPTRAPEVAGDSEPRALVTAG